jgi:hypothetical protein
MAESEKLDAMIKENLAGLGYGEWLAVNIAWWVFTICLWKSTSSD